MGFFDKIKAGLAKTRAALSDTLGEVFTGFQTIDDDFYDELEETLILADLGVDTATKVVSELKNEKIDIIKWSEDPAEFVANALNPAHVISVFISDSEKICRVVVPDNQLSLAIGKEGQNARLAAKLTGWKIDIKSQTQVSELLQQTGQGIAEGPGKVIADEDEYDDYELPLDDEIE